MIHEESIVYPNSRIPENQRSTLVSQNGERAKLHSTGEVLLVNTLDTSPPEGLTQHLRDDITANVLSSGVIIKVKNTVPDTAEIKIMYLNGVINTIEAWKLKVASTEVIKVYLTPTTVTNGLIFLSK